MARNNCTDCWYRKKVGGMPYCDYFLSTGIRRPCPPGEGLPKEKEGVLWVRQECTG